MVVSYYVTYGCLIHLFWYFYIVTFFFFGINTLILVFYVLHVMRQTEINRQ